METWLFHFLIGLYLVLGESSLGDGVRFQDEEVAIVSDAALNCFIVILFESFDNFIFTFNHHIFIGSPNIWNIS